MTKTKHLGTRGEADARRLLDAHDLGAGFEVCWVLSPHEDARRELRHRLAEQAPQLIEISPSTDQSISAEVAERLAPPGADGRRPVIWVESHPYDEAAWLATLGALNQNRNTFAREAPFFWVMAGPMDLGAITPHRAPDLWSIRGLVLEVPDSPKLMRGGQVRWLHLSDVHFRDTERWERRTTLEALRRELGEQKLEPDLVFVTGDVAYSGKPAEYDQAELFFRKLADDLSLDPRERFFIVPGNHDVDQNQIKPAEKRILEGLANEQQVSEILSDADTLRLITRRLQSYCAFTQRLLGPAHGLYPERLARTDVVDVDGTQVGVLSLNSAWTATGTSADKGRLLVGAETVQTALAETEDALLRVALMHHPTADLRDFDQASIDELLASPKGAAFVLRGHRHKTGTLVHRSPSGQTWELAAGATYVEGEWPKGFLFGNLDLKAGKGEVRFFGFSSNDGGFWHPDNSAYRDCKDGIWNFDLPEHLHLGDVEASKAEGPAQISAARQRNLAERYRDAAAAVHGPHRCIGVAARSERPNVTTPVMFVPLKFKVQRQGDKEKEWDMAQLVQALVRPIEDNNFDASASRIMILGDPGSGKTTLCRYLTVILAKGGEGVAPFAEGALPLFLPFRDYVFTARNQPDLSLVEYIELQAKRDLSVTLPAGFLEQKLESGEAVLLLDGMDEVGNASDRVSMRDRVLGFCESFPNVPVLVTSRITGYWDAPMPRIASVTSFKSGSGRHRVRGLHGDLESVEAAAKALIGDPGDDNAELESVWTRRFFEHLQITPFDDAALDDFVRRWYALQEPENAQHRSERIADLLAALEAEPRVKEMARNPLLATLIALIHRSEAHLPGERAELYERCVQTLIVDWPAARKSTFKEIDEGLQRRYLEQLALEMQRERTGEQKEVVIERKDLEQSLLRSVKQHHDPDRSETLTRRWIEYLEKGTGVLVEQRPGVYGFLHLSLMEYLAASALDRAAITATALVEEIAHKHENPAWWEVCLLVVGRRATDEIFLDALFEALLNTYRLARLFLLECLRDEAAFVPEQREAILDAAGQFVLDTWPGPAVQASTAFDTLLRFSRRHKQAVQDWHADRVNNKLGQLLVGAVALRIERRQEIEVIGQLQLRKDKPEAACALLEFFASTYVGMWAANNVSVQLALEWALSNCAEDLLTTNSFLGLQGQYSSVSVRVGLVAAISQRAVREAWRARKAAETLMNEPRRDGRGLPFQLRIRPGNNDSCILPIAWPGRLRCNLGQDAIAEARLLIRHLASGTAHRLGVWLPTNVSAFLVYRKNSNLAAMFEPHAGISLYQDVISEYITPLSETVLEEGTFQYNLLRRSTNFALESSPSADVPMCPIGPPNASGRARTSSLLKALADAAIESKTVAAEPLLALLATDCWIAVVTTLPETEEKCARYLIHRLQSRWSLLVWEGIDKLVATADPMVATADPSSLALYLALGWSQATVTYEWPDSEIWRGIFASPPPEHWLPRLYFELCYLTHDPNLREHYDAFFDALNRGFEDPELSIVAEKLKELFPPYETAN